jgi:ABC-type uncharacterized transport system permease subunit
MWSLLEVAVEVAIEIAVAFSSWRVWISIFLAAGIIAAAYAKFPDHDGFWAVSVPLGMMIIGLGCWWEWRANRS